MPVGPSRETTSSCPIKQTSAAAFPIDCAGELHLRARGTFAIRRYLAWRYSYCICTVCDDREIVPFGEVELFASAVQVAPAVRELASFFRSLYIATSGLRFIIFSPKSRRTNTSALFEDELPPHYLSTTQNTCVVIPGLALVPIRELGTHHAHTVHAGLTMLAVPGLRLPFGIWLIGNATIFDQREFAILRLGFLLRAALLRGGGPFLINKRRGGTPHLTRPTEAARVCGADQQCLVRHDRLQRARDELLVNRIALRGSTRLPRTIRRAGPARPVVHCRRSSLAGRLMSLGRDSRIDARPADRLGPTHAGNLRTRLPKGRLLVGGGLRTSTVRGAADAGGPESSIIGRHVRVCRRCGRADGVHGLQRPVLSESRRCGGAHTHLVLRGMKLCCGGCAYASGPAGDEIVHTHLILRGMKFCMPKKTKRLVYAITQSMCVRTPLTRR